VLIKSASGYAQGEHVSSKIMAVFDEHPAEAFNLASILAGYGELEFCLQECLGTVLRDDGASVRLLFRIRSESQRIDAADSILRPAMKELGAEGAYGQMLGALRWCRSMRNTYAHCHWWGSDGVLWYTNLAETAKRLDDNVMLRFVAVDAALLTEQDAFFGYTAECLHHLRFLSLKAIRPELAVAEFKRPTARKAPATHCESGKYKLHVGDTTY
jgi:hypothetical protein